MNAYIATCPRNDRFSRAEASCKYYLPRVTCEACHETWRWSQVWYPSYELAKGANTAKFTDETIVTTSELASMRKQVVGKGVENAKLLPGSGIGPVHAKLPARATDFVWFEFRLLASRHALDALELAGIHVPHGPVIMTGKNKADYVAFQLDPVPLYSKKTMEEMTLVFCQSCGQLSMQNLRAKPNGPREFIRERMSEEAGLVQVYGEYVILATEKFMEVVKSQELSGMDFKEFGIYV